MNSFWKGVSLTLILLIGIVVTYNVYMGNSQSSNNSAIQNQKEYQRQIEIYDKQSAEYDKQTAEYDKQTAEYNEQQLEGARQLKEAAIQLEISKTQTNRMNALLARWEKQADRYDSILDKWEQQISNKSQ